MRNSTEIKSLKTDQWVSISSTLPYHCIKTQPVFIVGQWKTYQLFRNADIPTQHDTRHNNNLDMIIPREPTIAIHAGSPINSPALLLRFSQCCGTHRCTRVGNHSMWGWADTCEKWSPAASSPSCSWRTRCCWSVWGGCRRVGDVKMWSISVRLLQHHLISLNHWD